MFEIDEDALNQIEGYTAAIKMLAKLGSKIRAVDLHAKNRQEDGGKRGLNNAQILEYLADGGRDFVMADDAIVKKTAQAIVDSVMEDMQQFLKRVEKRKKGKRPESAEERVATEIASRAFKRAGEVWLEQITENIEAGKWEGDGSDRLNPDYEKRKQAKHGFAYPIGKATGQLLDNVAPKNRNLKTRT